MDKLERYIEYIVNDLINNTFIDDVSYSEGGIIRHNFIPIPAIEPHLLILYRNPNTLIKVTDSLKSLYGVHDEEIQIIWDKYIERLQALIEK